MAIRGKRQSTNKNDPVLLNDTSHIVSKYRPDGSFRLDIERAIKENGINLKKDPNLPQVISGFLQKENDEWTISVNANHNPKRQRFTMAHEFAHYCLHKNDNDSFEDGIFFRTDNSDSREYAANRFASEILMPTTDVKSLIASGVLNIAKLSTIFDVSLMAMKTRVSELGYKTTK